MRCNPTKTSRTLLKTIGFVTLLYTCAIVNSWMRPLDGSARIPPMSWPLYDEDFIRAVAERADEDRYIILAMTDEAFRDIAINFYEASLRAHRVDNFLFVGVGRKSCDPLSNLSIACFHYADDSKAAMASSYGQLAFIRKMNIRTDMILEAMAANFTVIHSDTDISFLANPVPQLKAATKCTDLAAMWDNSFNSYNAGFLVVRPTPFSFLVYSIIKDITSTHRWTDDQQALNKAIAMLHKQKIALKASVLDRNVYMNGNNYFEHSRRLLPRADDPCSPVNRADNCSVLVVHNNWIVNREAKIYRFREHLMWLHDGDDRYYSSVTRKYLTYVNAKPAISVERLSLWQQRQLRRRQMSALKTALCIGHLLNRVVILPRFYCGRHASPCPLNSLIHMSHFDAVFAKRYRESSFLRHPKVPDNVKRSASNHNRVSWTSRSATSDDVIRLFRNSKERVINFEVLDEIHVAFTNRSDGTSFSRMMSKAIRHSDYRQQILGRSL